VGILVPWLHRGGGPQQVRLVPVPGGFAVAGDF